MTPEASVAARLVADGITSVRGRCQEWAGALGVFECEIPADAHAATPLVGVCLLCGYCEHFSHKYYLERVVSYHVARCESSEALRAGPHAMGG